MKLDSAKYGIPVSGLRELNILLNLRHRNIVQLNEVYSIRLNEKSAEDTLLEHEFSPIDRRGKKFDQHLPGDGVLRAGPCQLAGQHESTVHRSSSEVHHAAGECSKKSASYHPMN